MFRKYGNWVANTRLPQFGFARRLAKSNPEDFGKYVFAITLSNIASLITRQMMQSQSQKSLDTAFWEGYYAGLNDGRNERDLTLAN